MLYTNWRDEASDLLNSSSTYENRYLKIKERIEQVRLQYEPHRQEIDEALNSLENQDLQDAWDQVAPTTENQEAIDEDMQTDNSQGEHYDSGQDLGLPARIVPENLQPSQIIPDEEYLALMRSLNEKQSEFVMDILHHAKTSDDPICTFLTGGAGVGKTHVTLALYQSLYRYLNKKPGVDPDKPCILLLAPTGKAAYLIRGSTIHSALKIPVNQKLQYKALDTDTLSTLRAQMTNLKYVFIDEVSMVGSSLINFVHKRLQEIMGSAKDFGGLSVIFVGDLFQLKPVCDTFIFKNSGSGYSPLATNLWQQNVTMFELKTVMRQDSGGQFAHLLNRMREGHLNENDRKMIATRVIEQDSAKHRRLSESLHLYLQNDRVDAHNTQTYLNAQTEKFDIKAIDAAVESLTPEHRRGLLARIPTDPRKTMQLPCELQVGIGLKYEIALNINTADGLTNGACCIVKSVHVPPNKKARGVIWVEFEDKNIGKITRNQHRNVSTLHIDPTWTPIMPETRKFAVGKNNEVTRTQFPLRPASAKTVHRSQGDTVSEIVIDFTGRSQMHIHYVAMSRVREFQNLHLLNFEPQKIKVSDDVKIEMARLRQQPYSAKQIQLNGITAHLKIAYINAQSLHKHRLDVAQDHNMTSVDILICAETRYQESDTNADTEIPGFSCFRNDAEKKGAQRPVYGLAIYYKPDLMKHSPVKTNKNGVEMQVCTVKTAPKETKIVSVYKLPAVTLKSLQDALFSVIRQHIKANETFILIGDFNIDVLNPNLLYEQLQEFMTDVGLKQHINEYTTDMRTAIDHLYSNASNITCGTIETYFSFHKAVWIALH